MFIEKFNSQNKGQRNKYETFDVLLKRLIHLCFSFLMEKNILTFQKEHSKIQCTDYRSTGSLKYTIEEKGQ